MEPRTNEPPPSLREAAAHSIGQSSQTASHGSSSPTRARRSGSPTRRWLLRLSKPMPSVLVFGLSAETGRRRVKDGVWPASRDGSRNRFGSEEIAAIEVWVRPKPPAPRLSSLERRQPNKRLRNLLPGGQRPRRDHGQDCPAVARDPATAPALWRHKASLSAVVLNDAYTTLL